MPRNYMRRHPRLTRASKATARFLCLIGATVVFALAYVRDGNLVGLGMVLAIISALFYDPENPPNATYFPAEEHDIEH